MKFSELVNINIEDKINSYFSWEANYDNMTAKFFSQIWKVNAIQYAHLDMLVDGEIAALIYESAVVNSFMENKQDIIIFRNADSFNNIREFKKKQTQSDSRNSSQNTQVQGEGKMIEGYAGFDQNNQDGNFKQDKTTNTSNSRYTANGSLTRNIDDDDPELAVRVLRNQLNIKIAQDVKKFILNYCKVII